MKIGDVIQIGNLELILKKSFYKIFKINKNIIFK